MERGEEKEKKWIFKRSKKVSTVTEYFHVYDWVISPYHITLCKMYFTLAMEKSGKQQMTYDLIASLSLPSI